MDVQRHAHRQRSGEGLAVFFGTDVPLISGHSPFPPFLNCIAIPATLSFNIDSLMIADSGELDSKRIRDALLGGFAVSIYFAFVIATSIVGSFYASRDPLMQIDGIVPIQLAIAVNLVIGAAVFLRMAHLISHLQGAYSKLVRRVAFAAVAVAMLAPLPIVFLATDPLTPSDCSSNMEVGCQTEADQNMLADINQAQAYAFIVFAAGVALSLYGAIAYLIHNNPYKRVG